MVAELLKQPRRRSRPRHEIAEPTVDKRTSGQAAMNRLLAEYLEMPGLCLTEPQIVRMCDVSPDLVDAVLQHLQRACFLRLTESGTYVRVDLCTN